MADTNELLDTSNEEYTTVNNLTPITSIAGSERLHLQDEENNDWSASVDEVGEHVLAHISEYQEPTYNTDNDLFPVVVSGQPAKQKLGTLSTYIANKALQSVEATVDCDSLGSAENKVITLDIIPAELHINFTHGNTYGDTTIAQPTHPSIVIQNTSNEVIATLDICDSRGHYAGTGCWNDNDTIDFQVSLSGEDTGKARIKNSDVRQADENYIIKSDGYIKHLDVKDILPKQFPVTAEYDGTVYVSVTATASGSYLYLKCNDRVYFGSGPQGTNYSISIPVAEGDVITVTNSSSARIDTLVLQGV